MPETRELPLMWNKISEHKKNTLVRGAGKNSVKDSKNVLSLRKCLVTGLQLPKDRLLRLVVGPDKNLVPDLDEKLPGRGLWLSSERYMVNTAYEKGLFAKAARFDVNLSENLADQIESLMKQRCLDLISLARRAGEVVSGFEKTKAWLRKGRCGVLLQASDGSADGKKKIKLIAEGFAMVDIFDAKEIGQALGRDNTVHGVVASGGIASRLIKSTDRLMAFRGPKS